MDHRMGADATTPIGPGDEPSAADSGSLGGLTESLGLDPVAVSVDPLLGRTVGGVTLVRLIAEGGMGRVYEGLQDKPRRPVAVKVMRPGLVSKEICRRFDHESEVLGRLRHPSIAQIYSAGICMILGAEVPYFVMEYVPDALTITAFVTRHRLTTEQRIGLFRKVCEAVAHGHAKGVIHRDLKPGNILVDPSGNPRVIDFGVARSADSSPDSRTAITDVGQLVGTVQYMSPEQFAADPMQVDTRADVYALGVILYELLTGRPPYELRRKQVFEAAEVVRRQKPVSPSSLNHDVGAGVEKIAGKCLQKNRLRRYADAGELVRELEACVGDVGGGPLRGGRGGLRPWSGGIWRRDRRRTWVWSALLGVSALAASLAAGFLGGPRPIRTSRGVELLPIPAGRFMIGSPADESSRQENERQQEVRITEPFWIGRCEVTQSQWRSLMGTQPWLVHRALPPDGDAPAVCISWNDAVAFCARLTAHERDNGTLPNGLEYRLPTEAEWEYACRAGSTDRYCYGDDEADLGGYAWFEANAREAGRPSPQPVGRKVANRWGLHDMHGNAWEWILDAWGDQPQGGDDPLRVASTEKRILRGGSWFTPASDARSARRHSGPDDNADNRFRNAGDIGFRVVLGRPLRPPPSASRPQAPSRLTAFRGSVERTLVFEVVGHDRCPVWGSNPYTDDSCLATACVHAGRLKPGERGLVAVTLIPALDRAAGSLAHGVRSLPWGPWVGGFRIEEPPGSGDDVWRSDANDASVIQLVDLPVKRSLVGWGTFRAGKCPDVVVNGEVPPSVVVAHASSFVVYELPQDFRGWLQGSVALSGVSKEVKTPGSCRFRILGDDALLWESGVIGQDSASGGSITERFRVRLEGCGKLGLEVDALGPNHSDWSVWVHPVLVSQGDLPTTATRGNAGE